MRDFDDETCVQCGNSKSKSYMELDDDQKLAAEAKAVDSDSKTPIETRLICMRCFASRDCSEIRA